MLVRHLSPSAWVLLLPLFAASACGSFQPVPPIVEAQRDCQTKIAGESRQGFEAKLAFSRKELESVHAHVDLAMYTRLSQQLEGYNAGWQQVYSGAETACTQWKVCEIRLDATPPRALSCTVEFASWEKEQKNGRTFILELETLKNRIASLPHGDMQPLGQVPQTASPSVSSSGEVVVGFSGVNIASTSDFTVAALPYLHDAGITVEEMKPHSSELLLVNNRAIYGGQAIHPTWSQNFLTQGSTGNTQASFTLKFTKPLQRLSITRPMLYAATKSGITHPAWSAHALDATGVELSSVSEGLTRSFSDVPSQIYTLVAPGFRGIKAVRFDSDPRLNGEPFAAFSTVMIERLTLISRPGASD